MPIPMESLCVTRLFQIAVGFGGILAKAQQPTSTWDQDLISRTLDIFATVGRECQLATHCMVPASDLHQALLALKELGEEAIPDKMLEQIRPLHEGFTEFYKCLFPAYEVGTRSDVNGGGRPPGDFPGDDWLQIPIVPRRHKAVR